LTYYAREVQGLDQRVQIWRITDDEAICLLPTRGDLLRYRPATGETIWEAINRQGAWQRPDGSLPVYELKVAPGHYFPRIARSVVGSSSPTSGWQPSWAGSENAIASVLIPEEAAPQFRDDVAPRNGMMSPPDSEMIAPPIRE
jgi:hypothetical protein